MTSIIYLSSSEKYKNALAFIIESITERQVESIDDFLIFDREEIGEFGDEYHFDLEAYSKALESLQGFAMNARLHSLK